MLIIFSIKTFWILSLILFKEFCCFPFFDNFLHAYSVSWSYAFTISFMAIFLDPPQKLFLLTLCCLLPFIKFYITPSPPSDTYESLVTGYGAIHWSWINYSERKINDSLYPSDHQLPKDYIIRSWTSKEPPSTLEFEYSWSYVCLMQVITPIMNSWMWHLCHIQNIKFHRTLCNVPVLIFFEVYCPIFHMFSDPFVGERLDIEVPWELGTPSFILNSLTVCL